MSSNELMRQINIDYLTNTKQTTTSTARGERKVNKKDRKFYKKRIYSLTKELLLNEEPDHLCPEIKKQFDEYINSCVHYFKSIDSNDLIQDDYKLLDADNQYIDETVMVKSQTDADELFINSFNNETKLLDYFVIKTKLKIKKDDMILPKQKNINLRDPELKHKGVKISSKKKNIANKYENTNQKNETPLDEEA